MTPHQWLRRLEANAAPAPEDPQGTAARIAARILWSRQTIEAMFAAQERVGQAWAEIFDALGDAADDLSEEELEALPEPPEQAEVNRLYELIAAVREHDRWPRELHWSV